MLQAADLVVINGATYESWLDSVSLDDSKVFDSTHELSESFIKTDDSVTHSHGPTGEHSHSGIGSQLWLDPRLAVGQAGSLEKYLVQSLPESMRFDLRNQAIKLNDRLLSMEAEFVAKTDKCRGWSVITSHPVYQYLAERLEWQVHSMHWEPNETPSDEEFASLQAAIDDSGAKIMIWEAEPTPETRARLEAMGLVIAVYDPCFQAPSEGDWFSVMEANVERLDQARVAAGQ